MKYYKLSEDELSELISGALYNCALEQGGVDNWWWYGESIQNFIETCNEEDGTNYETIDEITKDEIARYELLGEE
jgi:hypothetical protein